MRRRESALALTTSSLVPTWPGSHASARCARECHVQHGGYVRSQTQVDSCVLDTEPFASLEKAACTE